MQTADTATGYLAKEAKIDHALTAVERGAPMGELLRRYWHPVALSGDATDTPKAVRVLSEDLVLFRDSKGIPGLVHARCAHRGASLFYGKVEEEGIRCCYHGWLFDAQGHCLQQPCEPEGGRNLERIRQPWYPVEERYGLIFAYMGPPDKKPILPSYQALEQLDEGEFVEADDNSIGGGGPRIIPCNWLQHYENVVDPFHVPILHGSFSGAQFVELMGKMPQVTFESCATGVKVISVRATDEGGTFTRITQAAVPTLRVVPDPRVGKFGPVSSIGWVLPIDSGSFRIYTAGKVRNVGELRSVRSRQNGKLWEDLTPEEHQQFPGDYEAQVSQGVTAAHSCEHLSSSDRGIVMLRRFLKEQLDAVATGQNPAGVSFDVASSLVKFDAGNFLEKS